MQKGRLPGWQKDCPVHGQLRVYISDLFAPVEYPELPDSKGRQMTIIGNYLFQTQNLADDFNGIQVIDISNPMSMQHLGEIDTGCHATDVYGYNNYLFVTCDYSDKLMMIYRIE